MCRIAGYFGPPRTPDELVFGGTHSLASQSWAPRELLHGTINVDGWGVAWCDDLGTERLTRMAPTWHEPQTREILRRLESGAMLAALRNATPGIPVDPSGTPPFVRSGWGFCLNGFVPAFRTNHMRALRASLGDDSYGQLTGVSDTETLFLLILEQMTAGAGPLDSMVAIREMVRGRMAPGEDAPLTMAMVSAAGLWVLNSSAGGPVNSLYVGEGVEPMGTGVTVASERLSEGAWTAVPPHSAVCVNSSGVEVVTT